MSIVDEVFAAVPREHWSDGPLWRCPDDSRAALWLAKADAPTPDLSPAERYAAWAALGLSSEEIAEEEHTTPAAVRMALHRSRRKAAGPGRPSSLDAEQRAAVLRLAAAAQTRTRRACWAAIAEQVGCSVAAARMVWYRARKGVA